MHRWVFQINSASRNQNTWNWKQSVHFVVLFNFFHFWIFHFYLAYINTCLVLQYLAYISIFQFLKWNALVISSCAVLFVYFSSFIYLFVLRSWFWRHFNEYQTWKESNSILSDNNSTFMLFLILNKHMYFPKYNFQLKVVKFLLLWWWFCFFLCFNFCQSYAFSCVLNNYL